MTHLHLSRWNGQFASPGVIATIRRKISGAMAGGECVVIYDGDAKGLTDELRAEIQKDWPATKVRFSHVHPSFDPATEKKPRPRRRKRL